MIVSHFVNAFYFKVSFFKVKKGKVIVNTGSVYTRAAQKKGTICQRKKDRVLSQKNLNRF